MEVWLESAQFLLHASQHDRTLSRYHGRADRSLRAVSMTTKLSIEGNEPPVTSTVGFMAPDGQDSTLEN